MARGGDLAMARLVALAVPLALIAGALGSQHIGGLHPCEMCHWQRWPHYAAIAVAALAFAVPGRVERTVLVAFAALLVATSGVIGVLHAGVEYHWWPGFTGCTATLDSRLSAEQMLEQIGKAPLIRCDQPQWTLFGISMAGYNAVVSIGAAATVLALLWRGRRA